MNVVLDTNVLVSAILSPGRKAYSIFQSAVFGDFQIVFDSQTAHSLAFGEPPIRFHSATMRAYSA